MQRLTCIVCESPAYGFLLNDPTLGICRRCRDYTLSWLGGLDVELTTENPFIADLCINSHHLRFAWFEFYDCVNQCKGEVKGTGDAR